MVAPCGTSDLAKRNRSIDLSTGFLVAILNIMEIATLLGSDAKNEYTK